MNILVSPGILQNQTKPFLPVLWKWKVYCKWPWPWYEKKIIIVLRYTPKAKHIRHLEHDTQQGNKNYKYRKGITLNVFLWFQSQRQGIKHFYSAFQRYKIYMKESNKARKAPRLIRKKKLLRERIYQGIQQFKDINFSLAE